MSEKNKHTSHLPSYEDTFFEFQYSLKMNGIGILARDINIFGYNNKFRESYESKELMDEIMGDGSGHCNGVVGIIPRYLIERSRKDLWDLKNENRLGTLPNKLRKKSTKFVFEITKRIKNTEQSEVIVSAEFDAKCIQSVALKEINLKEDLKKITDLIRQYATIEDLTLEYGGTLLKRNNKLNRETLNKIVNANK